MCLPYSFFPVFLFSLPPFSLFFLLSFLTFPFLAPSFSLNYHSFFFPHLSFSSSSRHFLLLLPSPPSPPFFLPSPFLLFPRPPAPLCLSLLRPTPVSLPRPVPPCPAPPALLRPGGAAQAACPGGAERAPSGEHSVPERPRPPTCAPARSAAREQWLHCCGGWREPSGTVLVAG